MVRGHCWPGNTRLRRTQLGGYVFSVFTVSDKGRIMKRWTRGVRGSFLKSCPAVTHALGVITQNMAPSSSGLLTPPTPSCNCNYEDECERGQVERERERLRHMFYRWHRVWYLSRATPYVLGCKHLYIYIYTHLYTDAYMCIYIVAMLIFAPNTNFTWLKSYSSEIPAALVQISLLFWGYLRLIARTHTHPAAATLLRYCSSWFMCTIPPKNPD